MYVPMYERGDTASRILNLFNMEQANYNKLSKSCFLSSQTYASLQLA